MNWFVLRYILGLSIGLVPLITILICFVFIKNIQKSIKKRVIAALISSVYAGIMIVILPSIYPDNKERTRLTEEYNYIDDERSSSPTISMELYDRMVQFNTDFESYNSKYNDVPLEFIDAPFNTDDFDTKCRLPNAYNDYTVYIDNKEVNRDSVVLYKYLIGYYIEVDDSNKVIYIKRQ